MVLVFGILGLIPGYGVIFGPLAWGFGNREIREIDAGQRLPSGRTKARIGRVLGIIGTLISGVLLVLVAVGVAVGDNEESMTESSWFADHGVTFVYPADWEETDIDDVAPPEGVFQFMVTPDQGSSGNWIAFFHYPLSVAADYGATDETFDLDSHIRARGLSHGPTEITIAGLSGREMGVFGNIRNQTGATYEGEVVWLYGEDATYLLMAQYEPGSEDIVLSAWQTMLTNFDIDGISSDAEAETGWSRVPPRTKCCLGLPSTIALDQSPAPRVGFDPDTLRPGSALTAAEFREEDVARFCERSTSAG
jgi:hypothetical protein